MALIEEWSLASGFAEDERSQVDLVVLVETYSALLYRIAYSVLRHQAEAEDVVQDTFLRVINHRHALPAIRDSRVWLTRIAWNLALDRKRRIRPEQMDDSLSRSLMAHSLPADQVQSIAPASLL